MDKKNKLYAAYCAGLIEGDSVRACYPLVENAMVEAGKYEFLDSEVISEVESSIGVYLEIGVVRQILQEGIRTGRLKPRGNGRYTLINNAESKSDISAFDVKIDELIHKFKAFCEKNCYQCHRDDELREWIIAALDKVDAKVLSGKLADSDNADADIDYSLCKFIEDCSRNDIDLFAFILNLCLSNLKIESIAYSPSSAVNLKDLTVCLDTPIVYALLQLSDDASNDVYPRMINSLKDLGCKVRILDRNWDEFYGAIQATISWTYSPSYDALSANTCARVMRANWRSETECAGAIEDRIRVMYAHGISIVATEYNRSEDRFQIDEISLRNRIARMYRASPNDDEHHKQRQIEVDTLAISMIYRLRHGGLAYRVSDARYVLMTPNITLAKACKLFDREMRKVAKQRYVIPACIHSDIFASLLWATNPEKFNNYCKDRMLALCYQESQPSQDVIRAFTKCLEKNKDCAAISDDTYVLLKCGVIVGHTLMRLTNGQSSAVNEDIVQKVLNSITEAERRKFEEEQSRLRIQLEEKGNEVQAFAQREEETRRENLELQKKLDAFIARNRSNSRRLATAVVYAGLLLFLGAVFSFLLWIGVGAVVSLLIVISVGCVEGWRMGSRSSIISICQRQIAARLQKNIEPFTEMS